MSDTSLKAEDIKKQVLVRLRKIEGQIRGIAGMVEGGKECSDILVQVKAVKSALKSMNGLILKRFLLTCFEDESRDADPEQIKRLEKMMAVVANFVD